MLVCIPRGVLSDYFVIVGFLSGLVSWCAVARVFWVVSWWMHVYWPKSKEPTPKNSCHILVSRHDLGPSSNIILRDFIYIGIYSAPVPSILMFDYIRLQACISSVLYW